MRKLNMWQRLGIVLSVLWIVGGAIWQRTSDTNRAEEMAQVSYLPCSERASQLPLGADTAANEKCMSKAIKDWNLWLEGSWENVASFALGPVILGWLIAYLVLWVARWVLGGRKISD